MVRRLLLALALGALVIGALAPVASAAKPEHFTETFEDEFRRAPAGVVCDFEYFQGFTGRDIVTIFENRVQVTRRSRSLTRTSIRATPWSRFSAYNITFYEDSDRTVGLVWHLRNKNGKMQVVPAGQLTFDENGVTHTPGINPNFSEVVCPALGGNPA